MCMYVAPDSVVTLTEVHVPLRLASVTAYSGQKYSMGETVPKPKQLED